MTEIPDDVMEAAMDAYEGMPIVHDGWNEDAVIMCIADAILAERERCARVAYTYADDHSGDHKMVGHIIGRKILYGSR